jgi:DNA invertase Pin-like site-specific DNA recombinase
MLDQTHPNKNIIPRRAVIYIRQAVSGDEILVSMLAACHRLADQANCIVVGEFKDIGVSGLTSAATRAGLSQVIRLAMHQQIDVVISPANHHLGRNIEIVEDLLERLNALNVEILLDI